MKPITENIIEESAIELLQSQGLEYAIRKEINSKLNLYPYANPLFEMGKVDE